MIPHDFNGTGRYPVYHQNETFKLRYSEDKPYMNYNMGSHIPLITVNFAALFENSSYTYSTGPRMYDRYNPQQLSRINPSANQLGESIITDIDKAGKMRGSFTLRMLPDSLSISFCQVSRNYTHGKFTAALFKTNVLFIKENMDGSKIKIRNKIQLQGLKSKLNGKQTPPESELGSRRTRTQNAQTPAWLPMQGTGSKSL